MSIKVSTHERQFGIVRVYRERDTSVSLGSCVHRTRHERDEKEMSLLLQVVVAHLLCDEAEDE